MEEDYYIQLLERQLSGNINRAERKELSAWRKSSSANERMAKSIELAWELTAPRKDKPVAKADLDEAFMALEDRISAAENSSASDGKIVDLPKGTNRLRWSIAAAIALLLLAGGYLLRNPVSPSDQAPIFVTIEAEGATQLATLSDGTEIRLNSNSRLSYPQVFDGSERRVQLDGEAFFDVSRREDQPFIVETTTGEVRVLGTSFNVRSFAKQTSTEVYVATGQVEVLAKASNSKVLLSPQQVAIIDHAEGSLSMQEQASPNAMSWFSGEIAFEQQPLQIVLAEIEARYGFVFRLRNGALAKCLVDSTFDENKVERFINDIQLIFGAEVKQLGIQEYVIEGGSCIN